MGASHRRKHGVSIPACFLSVRCDSLCLTIQKTCDSSWKKPRSTPTTFGLARIRPQSLVIFSSQLRSERLLCGMQLNRWDTVDSQGVATTHCPPLFTSTENVPKDSMSAPTAQNAAKPLDAWNVTPNIANGLPDVANQLSDEMLTRFIDVEGDKGDWTVCNSDRVAELLVSEQTALAQGGCYKSEMRVWSPNTEMSEAIRTSCILPASPSVVASFLLSETEQSKPANNPRFSSYEKVQKVDLAKLATPLDAAVKHAFYLRVCMEPDPNADKADRVEGLKPMDVMLFVVHRQEEDGQHFIGGMSAYHSLHEPKADRVRAVFPVDYIILDAVQSSTGQRWTRVSTGNVSMIPGITNGHAITARLRGAIHRFNKYVKTVPTFAAGVAGSK
jgi:hypothetical protein